MSQGPIIIAGPHMGFDPGSAMGGERYEGTWLGALTNDRFQFHWIVREGMPGTSPCRLSPNHHFKAISSDRGLRRIAAEARAIRALDRKLGLNLVRLHSLHYGAATALALRALGVRTPLLVQHHHVEEPLKRYAKRARLLARLGAHFTSVSATSNEELIRLGVPRGQTTMIRSLLNGWKADFANLTHRSSNHDYDLVSLGGLIERKRPGHVLETAAELQKLLGRPVRIAIIGRGPLEAELRRQASALGVNAEFFTNASDDAKWSILARGKIFLFTSSQEGFGCAPLEALFAGLWVISSDAGALSEVLAGFPSATVVPPAQFNPQRLAALCQERIGSLPAPIDVNVVRPLIDSAAWADQHERLIVSLAR